VVPRMEALAEKAGLSPVELAEGILDVANATMEKAIRVISVERGYDPQEFTLLSFGGAGGMHAAFLAELLSIPRVLVPSNPGLLSAYGMLLADVVKDYSRTVMLPEREASPDALEEHFRHLEAQGKEDLLREGVPEGEIFLERYLDMRYEGQSYEIVVPCEGDFIERFHAEHERLYGYKNPGRRVEVVNVRLRARGVPEKPRLVPEEVTERPIPDGAILGTRKVLFRGDWLETTVFEREKLLPGNEFSGPAIVVEYSSTIVVPPGWSVSVDGFSNLVLERAE
ncbi:MAG: hydantoinase/oxoprolinase family protein, partial [Deltaproteobacteria bacterium]